METSWIRGGIVVHWQEGLTWWLQSAEAGKVRCGEGAVQLSSSAASLPASLDAAGGAWLELCYSES